MCRLQIRLTFSTFRLDFEDQAHVFRTWSIGHKIFLIQNCTTYKNIGGGQLIVLELLQKNTKKCRFDPY